MAFDQPTRNRLARFVGDARTLLTEEFTRQLQRAYGIDPASGEVADLDTALGHLDDATRATARLLRETAEHYQPGFARCPVKERRETLDRIVREQAFTVLNRLCALRMAEARGLLVESIGRGPQSKGFQLYARLAGPALGETGDAYRAYLFSLFDELAVDLPVLFDRFAPEGRLFPGEAALLRLFELLNHPEIEALWAEDETIGWVYQYFNSQEERRQMRAESAAPRNSRELAVRNQFFTPRYVVEFLADNTLGRTWYEMTQGQTGLVDSCRYLVRRPNEIFLAPGEQPPTEAEPADGLSQEELLRLPVYIPHRPLKDPRVILMLDPACGSMHFGLYAFDLFERIYEEAWELEAERGPKAFERPAGLAPLHESYADKESFLREVPRLIVERNIHGVDIDPRAVQIAGLALWLRAQRSWRDAGVRAQERPEIRRSNVVCAEPMPGDPALLEEFLARELSATVEDRVVAAMLRRVFKAMELAGEAGSLLKIEEEIGGIVAEGKRAWMRGPRYEQGSFFTDTAAEVMQRALDLDATGVTDETFWSRAEGRVIDALRAYAEGAANGGTYRRRLFADDAVQGFAFIDLCRRRYDVVLMNPPFGEPAIYSSNYFERLFSLSKHDLAIAMVEVWLNKLTPIGAIGAITTRNPLFNSSSQEWRKKFLIANGNLEVCLDLGMGVLDAMVETAAYIARPSKIDTRAIFVRLTNTPIDRKQIEAGMSISSLSSTLLKDQVFIRGLADLGNLPNSPLSYWVPDSLSRCFKDFPALRNSGGEAWVGLQTSNDDRFLRLWWETYSEAQWKPFPKGGEASPFFSDIHLVVKWHENGREMKAYHDHLNLLGKGTPGNGPRREFPFYFTPGLTWVYRTERFHVQPLPAGCITSTRGSGIYSPKRLGFLFGFLNSSLADALIKVLMGRNDHPQFDIDDVNAIPTPLLEDHELAVLSRNAWEYRARFMQFIEEYRGFYGGFAPSTNAPASIYMQISEIKSEKQLASRELSGIQQEIDRKSANLLGLTNEAVAKMGTMLLSWRDFAIPVGDDEDYAHRYISIMVGCLLGRWDVRYATGEKPAPELPDPFAPLPVCPPGMLQNKRGLPAAPEEVPANYPLRISWPGILVDDEGHREDIVGRVREALQVVWGERAEAIEQEACEILGVRSLRDYFRRPAGFFAEHLARYSKSRRQAPIYWPLSTPSGSYTLWLYYHRLTDQTLYSCVNDFVEPKLAQVRQELAWIAQHSSGGSAEARDVERLSDLEAELRDLRAELLRVAAFWKPNLNDGVQITVAPLWRLFQHKPWQKRLKETWEKLEKGEYDWAHLAYSIWPERVRDKCKSDKSLAIAHGLEELYVEAPAVAKKGRGRGKKAAVEGGGMFEGE